MIAKTSGGRYLTGMISILSQPGIQKRALPLSVKAWHQMIAAGLAPRRAELIRGVIVEKMSKSITHTKLAGRILAAFQRCLGSGFWIRKEDPLSLADSEPEPDVSVVEGKEEDFTDHPGSAKLVVEVAVTTLAEDREMAGLYAEASVEEFWLINAPERCVEVFRDPQNGRYLSSLRVAEGSMLQSSALPGVEVDVGALFAQL